MESGDASAIQILVLLVLVFLSAFFSSSETALMTVNKIRMRNLAEDGDKAAIRVLQVTDNPAKMLSAILIGNNIVNLSASSLATVLATEMYGKQWIGLATGILTLLILVFGEITPKTMATVSAEKLSFTAAKVIWPMMNLLTPVIYLVNQFSKGVLFLLRVDVNKKQDAITEDELRTIVEVSHEEGVIETEEKKMINNVFDFGDSVAKDVMVPRIDVVFVDAEATYEEMMELVREEKYTRYPVFEESTDHVIGIINVKDLLVMDEEMRQEFSVKKILREPLYTYEYKKVVELMLEMRKAQNNIVIVLDEYGATAGLITLEDMLEEIVGEIRDEYDEDEEEDLVAISDKEYIIEGSMKLDDLNEELNLELESEDYDSIGGLVIGLLDHLPAEGEMVDYQNLHIAVEKVDKNRIDKIHLWIKDDALAEDSAHDTSTNAQEEV